MKWPRVQILDLMGLVVLAAINCLPYRVSPGESIDISLASLWFSSLGLTPMASLLLVVFVRIVRCVRRTGAAGPFLSGFFVFGLASMVGAAIVFGSVQLAALYLESTGWAQMMTAPEPVQATPSAFQLFVMEVLTGCVLMLPQLIVAVLGGLLARWCGLTISRIQPVQKSEFVGRAERAEAS